MKRFSLSVILSLFALLIIFVAIFFIVREFNHQTDTAFDRREAIATLGALLIHEKFDGIIDVGISLASRGMVYQNIEKGDWNKSIDQGNIMVKSSEVIINDVLTETQNKIKDEAESRDITLSISQISPLMAINTDKKLLSRALFEIIENAVIYNHRGSTVEVKITPKEKEFLVEVMDNGFGITEEEQPAIFTKFFRGSNRGSWNAGGGLGLYIAKAYITLLGGKVWFNSKEGKGTTFFVSLPIA